MPLARVRSAVELGEDLLHGPAGARRRVGGNRVIDGYVIARRGELAAAIGQVQRKRRLEQRPDQGSQPLDQVVAAGCEDGEVEVGIGAHERLVVASRLMHQLQRGADAGDGFRIALLGGKSGGGGLDDRAQLDQVAQEFRGELRRLMPGEHIGIEQVPLGARQDVGAGPAAGGDEALGGEHLERFADRLAADGELAGELGLTRQERPLRDSARHDLAADLMRHLPMKGPRRVKASLGQGNTNAESMQQFLGAT